MEQWCQSCAEKETSWFLRKRNVSKKWERQCHHELVGDMIYLAEAQDLEPLHTDLGNLVSFLVLTQVS